MSTFTGSPSTSTPPTIRAFLLCLSHEFTRMDIDPTDPENAAGVRYLFRRGLTDSAATWFDESSFGQDKKPKWENLVDAFCQRWTGMSRAEVEIAAQEAEHPMFPPRPPPPSRAQMEAGMRACLEVQRQGVVHGKRPFASILLSPTHTLPPLLTHFSISHIAHAESSLAHLASLHFPQAYLWQCTLYTTWEPCAMCTGTIYWANIGRVVYGASEETLKRLTGEGNEENFTMSLPCRSVLEGGQKAIEVWGPMANEGLQEVEEEVIRVSEEWWQDRR